jgi:tetratricopeptide (TPR) repeat protein
LSKSTAGLETKFNSHLSKPFAVLFLLGKVYKKIIVSNCIAVDLISKTSAMKRIVFLLFAGFYTATAFSQITLTQLPSGGNKKAFVGERVGLTDITIHYDRPGVKGRDGKIWGQLVHKGFIDQGFGNTKAAPWRAGANENTTIEFSNDVMIEGKPLKKGIYGFFIAYDSTEATLIFSNNSTSWGSYYYNENEDALRVKVKPVKLDHSVEWLKYEFMNQTENTATIALEWERLMIPFKVETNYIKDQITSFQNELRTQRGFYWLAWDQAAQWALQHNTNLEQALQWADSASGPSFGGSNMFQPKATKAQILQKLGREQEAAAIMKAALPFANMQEIHNYGRSLLAQKKAKEALEVFQMNFNKNPNQFTTLVGMMRGYSANGDYKNALKYAQQALPLAPAGQKAAFETMIEKLKKGQDVN